MTAALRTSQVADAAGVNVQTLRYYERRGLLAEPRRTLGGHRLYPPDTVVALRSIKAAQRLGFTLEDIATLLALGRGSRRRAGGLHGRAVEKLTEVEARIADLTDIRDTLRAAVEAGCDDPDTCAATDACPSPSLPPAPRPTRTIWPSRRSRRRRNDGSPPRLRADRGNGVVRLARAAAVGG